MNEMLSNETLKKVSDEELRKLIKSSEDIIESNEKKITNLNREHNHLCGLHYKLIYAMNHGTKLDLSDLADIEKLIIKTKENTEEKLNELQDKNANIRAECIKYATIINSRIINKE